MNKQFNSIRYQDDFLINKIEKIRIEKILNLIGHHKKVLDIGCGDGFISELIAKNENDVVGIEIAENAIRKCKKKKITVIDADLNSDWYKKINQKFDVIVAGEIIEHIFDTDKFLQNIEKVMKKNGSVIITTPNLASFGRRIYLALGISPLMETTARKLDAGHIRYFTFKTLEKLLLENGLKIRNYQSDRVNFQSKGIFSSKFLAQIFPKIGRTIIVECVRK